MSYPFSYPEGQPVMKFAEAKARLAALNYSLSKNEMDHMRRKWPFRTTPTVGGGGTNYFNDLKAITLYILQVEEVRSWQEGVLQTN